MFLVFWSRWLWDLGCFGFKLICKKQKSGPWVPGGTPPRRFGKFQLDGHGIGSSSHLKHLKQSIYGIFDLLFLTHRIHVWYIYLHLVEIGVPPNHPFLIGFSILNHPFWGTPIFGNTHLARKLCPNGTQKSWNNCSNGFPWKRRLPQLQYIP